jgi:opacity protein-like surface antigen
MKNLLVLFGAVAISASCSYADQKQSKYYVGISGGLSQPLKSSFKITDDGQSIVTKVKNSYMGTLSLGYKIDESTSVEFSVDFKPKYPMQLQLPDPLGNLKTKARANIFVISVVHDLVKFGKLTPYFVAGAGVADINIKSDSKSLGGLVMFELEKNHRRVWAYQFGVGMHYAVTDSIAFDLSAKIQAISNVKVRYKKFNQSTGALDRKSTKQHLGVGEIVAGLVFNF